MVKRYLLTITILFISVILHFSNNIAINKTVALQLEDNSLLYSFGTIGSYNLGMLLLLITLICLCLVWIPYIVKIIK